jgi:hypothetical protein
MRAAFLAILGVTTLWWLAPESYADTPLPPCASSAGGPNACRHSTANSYEPQARPPHNAYGTPIGDKILTRHSKKKKAPELHTTPLPDA